MRKQQTTAGRGASVFSSNDHVLVTRDDMVVGKVKNKYFQIDMVTQKNLRVMTSGLSSIVYKNPPLYDRDQMNL